ncbi:peptidase S41 [Flavobacteriaceae bacterium R38]|nr:peptidase S41 [Flavobacteriaceae bacterium R38]
MKARYFIFTFIFLILFSCSSDDSTITTGENVSEPISNLSREQLNYLNRIIDVMEVNSINRNTIDWLTFRSRVIEAAEGATSRDELDTAITLALTLLGDNHSSYIKSDGTSLIGERDLDCSTQPARTISLDNIGYIKVTAFSGNRLQADQYATNLQNAIKNQDTPDLIGWIVDLRNNSGGNMWPMIAGTGPILGEGTAGAFVFPGRNDQNWGYFDGAGVNGGNELAKVSGPYTLINPNSKVAVLTNRRTASSGEAVTVAFRGKFNTRSFGEATCGVSTSNRLFDLGENTFLNLTTLYFADRNGNVYDNGIVPDEIIEDQNELQTRLEEWFSDTSN